MAAEGHELIVEGCHQFLRETSHDVVCEVLTEGHAVEVLRVMELLHDFQVGLKSFDLRREVIGNFLN